ncbi:MAG: hypothetical protein AAB489_00825 [Patescibacteria group bacterium]
MTTFLSTWNFFLSDDPVFRIIQIGLIALGFLDVFLILFATRDILLRSHSFVYQCFAIILTALLPFLGFLLYLLLRPSRTLHERETEELLRSLLTTKKEVVPEGGQG